MAVETRTYDWPNNVQVKVKVIPQQAEVAQGVPGRLRPRIFMTFGITRVVGCQPYASAAFTPGEIPDTHFQRLIRPQGTWFRREPRKKSPVTPPGIDPKTVELVAQCLNHYAMYRKIWIYFHYVKYVTFLCPTNCMLLAAACQDFLFLFLRQVISILSASFSYAHASPTQGFQKSLPLYLISHIRDLKYNFFGNMYYWML